jgi:hypothetical protein
MRSSPRRTTTAAADAPTGSRSAATSVATTSAWVRLAGLAVRRQASPRCDRLEARKEDRPRWLLNVVRPPVEVPGGSSFAARCGGTISRGPTTTGAVLR